MKQSFGKYIDYFLLLIISLLLLFYIYGEEYFSQTEYFLAGPADFVISHVFPFLATVLFWVYRQATRGKMVISAKIVDARTGKKPSTGQFIGRYLGYIPSTLFLGMGFLWVAFDKKKQGWHDKLAGTVVIRNRIKVEKVEFEKAT